MQLDADNNRIKTLSGKKSFWAILLILQLGALFLLSWIHRGGAFPLAVSLLLVSSLITVLFQWKYEKQQPVSRHEDDLPDTMPLGLLELDRDGNIRYLNRLAQAFLGKDMHISPGDPVTQLFVQADSTLFDNMLQLVLNTGKPTEQEWYMPLQERWLMIRLTPSDRGIHMFLQDITDGKKQASLLQLFESVITRSADSILITQAEPIDSPGPQIVYVNEAFTQMTGYQPEEVIGLSPRILQGPGTSRKELDRIREALLQWKPVEVELLNYKKNKEEFWVSISIVPVSNEKGWFTHWISIQRDITARKREEELLKGKNQELKNLSNYLQNVRENERELIAREVHEELGQLTTALKMDIDWLSIRLNGGESGIQSRLGNATSTLKIMLAYIHRLAARLRPSILDHFGLTVALEAHCRELQHQNGIACIFVSEIDEQDLSDEAKTTLFRIAQELLVNVLTHSGADQVNVVLSEKEENILLSVTDNGGGFETSEKRDTLGLIGLRERAHSLKGTLTIDSKPGQGTSVLATIPKIKHL